MRIVIGSFLIAVLMHFGVRLEAQSTKAELSGVILDPEGLPVEGADIRLLNTSTDAEQSITSGPDGQYHFFAVQPGTYTITVNKSGFSALRRGGVTLRIGDQVSVDLALQIGAVEQSVDVIAATPLLQASRGTVSFVVEQKKVVTLPLDGRNFIPLIALSPGVMLPPGSTLPRINGSRPRVSEYIYDGISVLQPEPGQVAYFPVVDAIEEFRVETNSYSAEYGRSNGGVIMVNHKSGANEFHGSLFEFFRNEAINARNLFATTGPKPRFRRNQYGFVFGGPVQRNKTFFFADYQGTRLQTGTPRISTVPTSLQRRGIFAGAIYDPATTRQTGNGYVRDRFLNDTIPQDRFDPAVRAVFDRYPLPNVFQANGQEATSNNYTRVANEITNQDQFGVRLDHHLNARQRLFGRYEFLRDDSLPSTPLPDGSGVITAGITGETLTRADSVTLEHNWTLSGSKVNQLRFGYTRRGFDRSSLQTGQPASQLSGVPNIPVSAFPDVLPTYDVVGFQQLGPPVNGNASFTTSVTQFVDSFSWLRGRHSMKLGTDWRFEHLNILQPPSPTGNFQFSNILTSNLSAAGAPVAGTGNAFASFLLGQVQTFSIDVQRDTLRPRAKIGELFFQDDFKATRRLSLNLGLRYTLNFPSTVVDDQSAVFNLERQKLDFLGTNGTSRSARELEKLNFAPRIGLAFRLTESFIVRSGYGITWIEQAGITTPFTTPFFPYIQTAGQRSLDNINPAFILSRGPSVRVQEPNPDSGLGQGVFAVEREQKSGYAQQWNLSFQKTFGQHWSTEVGYLGSKLTNLGVPDVNMNQLTVEQLALPNLTQQVENPFFGQIPESSSLGGRTIARQQLLRPFPRFTTVAFYRNNVGHSTYHSFQSRLERRFSNGLSFTAAYTFSKLIDDAGAVFDAAILTGPAAVFQAADSYNRRLEKDESTGSMPHVFSGSYVWEVPVGAGRRWDLSGWRNAIAGGWQLAGMLRLQSGSPLAVTQATNFNAFAGFGVQRPHKVVDPELPSDERGTARWFNTAAFSQAGQGVIGSSSRNPVVGPAYRALDVMVGKTFPITERVRAEFRAEAFNVTNTPSLTAPNTNFGNAAFGTITRAFDPRVFEMVMKVHF